MRIVAVDYRVVRWPIAPHGAAQGRTERTALILAVRDDAGATGLGEAAPLPGMSIDHIDDAIRACEELAARVPLTLEVPGHASAFADRITPAPAARFAIETALMSALAQRMGTSVASLLAPMPHAELRNCIVVDDDDEAVTALAASRAQSERTGQPAARLSPCLKIKAPTPADLERVRRIARAVPNVPLRIDANRGWPRADVRTLLASLAHLPIEYVEEPCVDAHHLLVEPLMVRIALDESLIELTPDELARALRSPHLAALVLKPTLLGGFAHCLELAAAAHKHGVTPVVTHALEGPVGTAACRELARAIGADVAVGLAPHSAELAFCLDATRESHEDRSPRRPESDLRTIVAHDPASTLATHTAETVGAAELALPIDARSSVPRQQSHEDRSPRRPESDLRVLRVFVAHHPASILATHTVETVDAIRDAFRERRLIAVLHPKATPDEKDRQRALVDAASFERDDAVVLFTSGSTGRARGVVLSRQALLANAEASAARLGWRDDDRWLACLPLAHAGGLSVIIRCLLADRPVVLGDVTRIGEASLASLVPAQLAQLLEDPRWRSPRRLRAVLLGGAVAPPALIDAAIARGVPVLPTYGLTETFGQVATARVPGGRPVALPGVELMAGTREAPERIRIHGAMLASRYLDGAPIAPELVTADIGFVDGDELFVLGRADDVIISGGENVHPTQVEAVLAATPGVRAAAAFGVADARWGQIVAAAIAVEPAFERERAFERWHAQLPPHARPRRLAMLGELPLLPSGKLDRRQVAALPTSPIDYACYKPRG